MSIRTADQALDFLPEVERTKSRKGIFAALSSFVSAIADGQRAAADYDRMVAHGMGPSQAAHEVFERHFKSP